MSTKYIVNNITGQTINGNLTINGNIVITGSTTSDGQSLLPTYKVYTALLTQSGSSDVNTIYSGTIVKGVTYTYLTGGNENVDFSSVFPIPPGDIPNNMVATATGSPNNWDGVFLTYDTGAPVVTVLENTLGNIWFSYGTLGEYGCNSNNLFPFDKTFINVGSVGSVDYSTSGDLPIVQISILSSNSFTIQNTVQGTGTIREDGMLWNTPLEIRLYN
jgi:hypothetical protein